VTPDQWQVIQSLGTGGLLAFALVGGFRGWYVWGKAYDEIKEDRDFWRTTALSALGHADKAIDVVSKRG